MTDLSTLIDQLQNNSKPPTLDMRDLDCSMEYRQTRSGFVKGSADLLTKFSDIFRSEEKQSLVDAYHSDDDDYGTFGGFNQAMSEFK